MTRCQRRDQYRSIAKNPPQVAIDASKKVLLPLQLSMSSPTRPFSRDTALIKNYMSSNARFDFLAAVNLKHMLFSSSPTPASAIAGGSAPARTGKDPLELCFPLQRQCAQGFYLGIFRTAACRDPCWPSCQGTLRAETTPTSTRPYLHNHRIVSPSQACYIHSLPFLAPGLGPLRDSRDTNRALYCSPVSLLASIAHSIRDHQLRSSSPRRSRLRGMPT